MKELNARKDLSNEIMLGEFQNYVLEMCQRAQENILMYSGSDALSALIVKRDAPQGIYTNDGINILRSIEYHNPIQEHCASILRYVASRVDDKAHDGTSTSIFMAASFIKGCIKHLQHFGGFSESNRNTDYYKLAKYMGFAHRFADSVKFQLDQMIESISQHKVMLEDLDKDKRYDTIRQLILTTTKNNVEIADLLTRVMVDLPIELCKHIKFTRLSYETNDAFMMEEPDHDVEIHITETPSTQYNHALGSEVLYESANVLLVSDISQTAYVTIINYLTGVYLKEPNKPLFIISNNSDIQLINELNIVANRLRNNPTDNPHNIPLVIGFVLNLVNKFASNRLELDVIQAMSDTPISESLFTYNDVKNSIITDVKCHIQHHKLKISKLLKNPSINYVHYNYLNKDNNIEYTRIVNDLEKQIEHLESLHSRDNDTMTELGEYVRLYMTMIGSKIPKLVLGGLSTNHLANLDMTRDAIGSVLSAKRHGVVYDGIPKFIYEMYNIFNSSNKFSKTIIKDMFMFAVLTRSLVDKIDMDTFDDIQDSDDILKYLLNAYSGTGKVDFQPVQCFDIFNELLIRLKEVVPNFITCGNFIVSNATNAKEEK